MSFLCDWSSSTETFCRTSLHSRQIIEIVLTTQKKIDIDRLKCYWWCVNLLEQRIFRKLRNRNSSALLNTVVKVILINPDLKSSITLAEQRQNHCTIHSYLRDTCIFEHLVFRTWYMKRNSCSKHRTLPFANRTETHKTRVPNFFGMVVERERATLTNKGLYLTGEH